MRTIKGNLAQLNKEEKNNEVDGTTIHVQTFSINNNKIELTTHQSIDARNGDRVIVAGIDGMDQIFKAYSLKILD